jgi:predicted DNA-binding transcriptional regulator AlpA
MPELKAHRPEEDAQQLAPGFPEKSTSDQGIGVTRAAQRHKQPVQRELLRAERASRLCDVSLATWWRWDAAGKVPAGIKISGGAKRWRRRELLAWIRAGCPPRRQWEVLRDQIGRRGKRAKA